jgi:hypothetical protein
MRDLRGRPERKIDTRVEAIMGSARGKAERSINISARNSDNGRGDNFICGPVTRDNTRTGRQIDAKDKEGHQDTPQTEIERKSKKRERERENKACLV